MRGCGKGFLLPGWLEGLVTCSGFQFPNESAAGNSHQQVFAGMTVHALAQAALPFLSNQTRLIILRDEVIQVVVGLQNHIASATAIATAGSSLGTILLSLERHAAFAAMARPRIDLDLVDEHPNKKGEARASPKFH